MIRLRKYNANFGEDNVADVFVGNLLFVSRDSRKRLKWKRKDGMGKSCID